MTPRKQNPTQKAANLKRIAVYGSLLFFLGIAQCSFFASLTFLPATPSIMVGAVAAVAMFESERAAAVCGIAAGFLADTLGGSGLSLSPLFYFILALIISAAAKKVLKGFFPWSLLLFLASFLGSAFTLICIRINTDSLGFVYALKAILLPQFILTFIFSLPLFFIFRAAFRLCAKKGKFKF